MATTRGLEAFTFRIVDLEETFSYIFDFVLVWADTWDILLWLGRESFESDSWGLLFEPVRFFFVLGLAELLLLALPESLSDEMLVRSASSAFETTSEILLLAT